MLCGFYYMYMLMLSGAQPLHSAASKAANSIVLSVFCIFRPTVPVLLPHLRRIGDKTGTVSVPLGVANRNRWTQRLVILHAEAY